MPKRCTKKDSSSDSALRNKISRDVVVLSHLLNAFFIVVECNRINVVREGRNEAWGLDSEAEL